MKVKNVVFDVGNVLVRYDPAHIVANVFPHHPDHDLLINGIFKHQTWLDLNLGRITEAQALKEYQKRLNLELSHLEHMAEFTKNSLTPLPGSFELLQRLHHNQYPLYALTDNTHEIMAHLTARYDFWPLFKGVVVSASVGHLKPSKEIFHHLLSTYQLTPEETVFLDDLEKNIEGARSMGMQGILFKDANQAMEQLRQLGIKL